jgi:beta-lactamase class A
VVAPVTSIVDGIRALLEDFSGTAGVWARSLDTGEEIAWQADESFPAASTIKVPILCEVFRQAGEGRFALADTRTLTAGDQVGGSGILKDLTPGLALTVKDLATLMIVISDNTATNMLIDLVGLDEVNAFCDRLGLHGTRLEFRVQRAPEAARVMNRSTPADLGLLMSMIARGEILTPQACQAMLVILDRQHFTDNITRRLADYDGYVEKGKEPLVIVGSKSGSIRGTRNDVGFVRARGGRYVIAMMSKGCSDLRFYHDNEASVLLPKISALIYAHFTARA